ncbi:thioesterase family protein [Candidatus Fermentibacteria bacterium]|nr:thioesterase family protein [Candidatus Fermentibacteria bacterium]
MNLNVLLSVRSSREHVVRESDTARAYGSGGVDVLATPALIALIESAARDTVQHTLPPGHTTVGSFVKMHHLAPTPVGHTVRVDVCVMSIEGRRIMFDVRGYDSAGLIAEGEHERVVIDLARFTTKAAERRGESSL